MINTFKGENQKGFSLIELIIVVMVIGIIAVIAVPNLLKARRATNEASAVSSVSVIMRSQVAYKMSLGAGDFTTIEELYNESFIDEVLGTGPHVKSGYYFEVDTFPSTPLREARMNIRGRPVVHALFNAIASTGGKDYGATEAGVIYQTEDNTAVTFDDTTRLPQGTAVPMKGN
jgi:prepilin-type N-terminal cleavage/methylation domain-containing protein